MEQNIFTLHPNKRNGFCVDKHPYEVIRDYIISTLIRDGDVSLDDLLDEAKNEYKVGFDENVSWYVLIVKLDLEASWVINSLYSVANSAIRTSLVQ